MAGSGWWEARSAEGHTRRERWTGYVIAGLDGNGKCRFWREEARAERDMMRCGYGDGGERISFEVIRPSSILWQSSAV